MKNWGTDGLVEAGTFQPCEHFPAPGYRSPAVGGCHWYTRSFAQEVARSSYKLQTKDASWTCSERQTSERPLVRKTQWCSVQWGVVPEKDSRIGNCRLPSKRQHEQILSSHSFCCWPVWNRHLDSLHGKGTFSFHLFPLCSHIVILTGEVTQT